jgi:hypothetical protein
MNDDAKRVGALRALATMHADECPVAKAMLKKADELESKSGKQKATTNAYRAGYETVFGAKQEVGQA